jgi:tryptophan halogenase
MRSGPHPDREASPAGSAYSGRWMDPTTGRSEERSPRFPRTVGVIGGGTAGHFAALALKRRFPELEVTLVESRALPVIGVGEATTTLMPPFLHRELGLDIVELFRAVRPTFKLGIKFLWGPPAVDWFTYPFGDAWPLESFVFEGNLQPQSLASLLIGADRGPVVRAPDGSLLSLLPSVKFAYHLDNQPFVAFLARAAARAGVMHVDVTLDAADVLQGGAGIAALRAADGRVLRFDLYVDATGFRSMLIGGALGSPFESFASSLFCDRAVVATVPQRGAVEPCTTAETMDAGWCWRIPLLGEDHRGYVHASAFLDEDAAVAEMRAKNPDMGEPRLVRFRSGRHRDFWVGNTVSVGNAYGFVEPLESTALHMVILELRYLTDGLEALRRGRFDPAFPERSSRAVGAHWDYLRWFLAVHYRFNQRLDTPFWRAARGETDVSGMADLLARFRRGGPWLGSGGGRFAVGDPTFGYAGLMMLLLGQGAEGSEHARPSMDREAWDAHLARLRGVAGRALPQREALSALVDSPDMLAQFVASPRSWCHAEHGFASARARGRASPR